MLQQVFFIHYYICRSMHKFSFFLYLSLPSTFSLFFLMIDFNGNWIVSCRQDVAIFFFFSVYLMQEEEREGKVNYLHFHFFFRER